MKFTVLKDNLKEAVLLAEKTTGRKSSLPILSAILITAEKGRITLTATNLETGIEITLPGKIEQEGRIAVPARVLSSYVGLLRDEQVEGLLEGDNLVLKTGAGRTVMRVYPADEFPLLPKTEEGHMIELPARTVRDSLRRVAVAAATSDIKPEIASILFAFTPKDLIIAATDSFRLAEAKITGTYGVSGDGMRFLLPVRSAHELVRLLDNEDGSVEAYISKGYVTFLTKRFRMVSRLTEGVYPDYERIIPTKFITEAQVKRDDVLEMLRLSSVFIGKLQDVALFVDPAGIMRVDTVNAEVGENTSHIPVEAKGETMQISFNHRYVLDGLTQLPGGDTFFGFTSASGPLLMQSKGEEGRYRYIVMPMKV
ncbi:MAG: DNA polymerase III subunit beta [Candidatus Ryanbacteria bacterium CG10_big_fil_rev_8_21_14_0_10_43_42]|uniref:Beta sliding clamp n=1 Tax=Candidatus Ryanbacteria bacterium CG10_big_fil_rev_8_21_14_0_10_43_42 TaxID=1974864 RepID=A0A2M8KWA3_9BACT|nr:MAG: DNA polymerase III subunit beta [Candidatus Ryanbacteria bacterium CG10_big_fil_rev_8_21_14_0_10_43_42]